MKIAGKILRALAILGFGLTLLGFLFGIAFQGSDSIDPATIPVLIFWAILAAIAVYYEKKANTKKSKDQIE
jgi:hypothetical protein